VHTGPEAVRSQFSHPTMMLAQMSQLFKDNVTSRPPKHCVQDVGDVSA
jgi:hypothetical protein